MDLYKNLLRNAFGRPMGDRTFAKNFFLSFITKYPVFSTLRRIDLIVRVSQDNHENAHRDMDTLVRCAAAECKALGVQDGRVRTFWELMPRGYPLAPGSG